MKIEEIKKQMLQFRDFYGGDLLNADEVEAATSRKELAGIIERHRQHLEAMSCDADSHLTNFKRKIGLELIDYEIDETAAPQ